MSGKVSLQDMFPNLLENKTRELTIPNIDYSTIEIRILAKCAEELSKVGTPITVENVLEVMKESSNAK